jgi:hypothetical protein
MAYIDSLTRQILVDENLIRSLRLASALPFLFHAKDLEIGQLRDDVWTKHTTGELLPVCRRSQQERAGDED